MSTVLAAMLLGLWSLRYVLAFVVVALVVGFVLEAYLERRDRAAATTTPRIPQQRKETR